MMNTELTIIDFLDRQYTLHEKEIQEIDFYNITEANNITLAKYAEEKKLITDTCSSIEFVAMGFANNVTENSITVSETSSLIEQEQALRNLITLTNDRDEDYIKFLYAHRYQGTKDITDSQDDYNTVITILNTLKENERFELQYQEEKANISNIMVSDIIKAIDETQVIMDSYGIDREYVIETTMLVIEEPQDTTQEFQKPQSSEGLVIIESNDGYVMATNASPELFAEHPELETQYNQTVHNGNEVVHNEAPHETTSDLSKVGGDIKYEQADDIGSIEKGQGVLSYEEKAEMHEGKTAEEKQSNRKCRTTTLEH